MTVHAMAEITPRPDKIDEVSDILAKVVDTTRCEDGNLVYDLFVSEDGDTFHIVEAWRDEDTLDAHMATDTFKAAIGKLEPLVAKPLRTFRMTPVTPVTTS